MTIIESLALLSTYPIPEGNLKVICIERELDEGEEYTSCISESRCYQLAKADCYKWLYYAPSSMSENGISFSLTERDKEHYRQLADEIYTKHKERKIKDIFGYKGMNL